MKLAITAALAAATALACTAASAQPAPTPAPAEAQPAPGPAPAAASTTTTTVDAEGVRRTLVASSPVPDTPENRAKYGKPMSNAGRRTRAAGN